MQQRVIGAGTRRALAQTIAKIAPAGPVLVMGGLNSYPARALADVLDELPHRPALLLSSGALPDTQSLRQCWQQISDLPGCIVAVGGGRILDLAKLLSTGLRNVDDLLDRIKDGAPPPRQLPLIALPTTAGSGSESTPFAVLYHHARKYSLDHPSLLPDAAIVDCGLMRSAPQRVRAASGLDALCQGIEALLSRKATAQSNALALRAIKQAKGALLASLADDRKAAAEMAQAANLAGRAIATTRTTVPHALSYSLTQEYGVAHGHAVALSMGAYLRHFGNALRRDTHLKPWTASYGGVLEMLDCSAPDEIPATWATFLAQTGLEPDLTSLHLPSSARLVAAQAVNPDRLRNSPLSLDTATLADLFA